MTSLVQRHQLDALEALLLQAADAAPADIPIEHVFAPGVYMRLMHAAAGTVVMGHEHKTKHINILLKGKARVLTGGAPIEIEAPYIVVSEPGDRKVAYVIEDLIWANIHPTEETDVAKIEEQTIVKSAVFLAHERLKEEQLCLG